MQDVRAAVHLLPLGVDAIEEASRMLLENVAYAHRLDDVDTNLRAHKRNPQSVARRVAPVSGVCASRGCPGDPPRGMSEANDAVGGEGAASARPRTGDRTRQPPADWRAHLSFPPTTTLGMRMVGCASATGAPWPSFPQVPVE